ncbi:maleylpyruvate isomerase family mycothiol-dependent enzyme [Amycolatopsis sp. H20-H5]|uniref:maleylpyruvate isomerase family mycothiol-dependent enzyme n=1 Tax=Amycolatopsis sp. H20-H5 TaxID=3046309 RepID=UPI002DBD0AF3|nr:maleylpyruvate isomerase family mycothiol-dependent enzyme [Amycolatopsis sp. H20-H5]MEC3974032.1 maleylpyruvate isomerase family mycothiol-dependent enzyme [Amycolatopsis sp. H20-H5]
MAGQAMIDQGRLLDVLEAEGRLLASVAHAASGDAPVPHCPGWTLGEVVRHVGSVYRVTRGWLAEGRRPDHWQRDPAREQTPAGFFEEGLRALLGELSAHRPGERAATWWPADPTYGFWGRRMAHETLIHRIDVETAAGQDVSEIPEDVALDGIDEALALWFGQKLPMLGLSGTKAGSVAVRTGGHSWLARAGPGETVAWRCSAEEAQRADDIVTGKPAQVYRWLWGRAGPPAVLIRGEQDMAGQLWALMRLATR